LVLRAKVNASIKKEKEEIALLDFTSLTSSFINALTQSTQRKCVTAFHLFLRFGCLPALHNNELIFLKVMEERRVGYKARI